MTAREERAVERVVLFDLDCTLVRCDTFARFNRDLLLRQWWRLALAIASVPLVVPLALITRTRLVAASIVAWAGTVGVDERELDQLMDWYVARRLRGREAMVCRTAIDALCRHHANGDRIFVVTGAPVALARRVCACIGVPVDARVEIVGSSLRRFGAGWAIGEHCFGAHKVRMLGAKGIARADCVYTDSLVDLPLLRLGARRVLVNASPRHRARALTVLDQRCELVTWP